MEDAGPVVAKTEHCARRLAQIADLDEEHTEIDEYNCEVHQIPKAVVGCTRKRPDDKVEREKCDAHADCEEHARMLVGFRYEEDKARQCEFAHHLDRLPPERRMLCDPKRRTGAE